MSDYEYDTGATRLVISEGLDVRDDKHFVIVSAEHLNDVNVAVAVQDDDAPAVALAILEAAGYGAGGLDTDVETAHAVLEHYQAKRAKQAECEALDEKVRAYLNKVLLNKVGDMYRITDHDRDEYARAAEFFQEPDKKVHNHAFGSAPADPCNACGPRVLNYGDPEPDRRTKWRDTGGNVWSYGDVCHRDYPVWRFESANGSSFGRWTHLDSCFFPMTEVTQ